MERIKTLIVDDEPFVAESLRGLIDWEALGFEIVGMCHSGKSALETVESRPVELLLCDIKMPEMNGIELVRQISEKHSQIENIIISGYSDFAYAQSAIRYGTTAYCLKPFDEQEVTAALTHVREKILKRREARRSDALTELLFLSNGIPAERLRADLAALRFDLGRPVYICVLRGCQCDFSDTAQSLGLQVGIQEYIYLLQPRDAFAPVMQRLRAVCAEQNASAGMVRIGDKMRIAAHIEHARQSAMSAFISEQAEPVLYEEVPAGQRRKKQDLLALLPSAGLNSAQKEQVIDRICKVFAEGRYTIQDAYHFHRLLMSRYLSNDYTGIFSCDSYEAMAEEFKTLRDMLRQIIQIDTSETVSIADSDSWIQTLKDYCEKNYSEPITITTASEMLHISPSYFSTLFKKATKENFTAYITHLRLKKACELLVSTGKNISDIAIDVGYSDYFYFTKVFRKHFRITPSEYRKNAQTAGEGREG